MIKKVPDYAFPILRDIYSVDEAEFETLDPDALIDRIQRVHKGLSAEHEFAAIAAWLGKCSLLSQLDDVLHSSGVYRAPDFLVVANHEGREVPFLVEVKSTDVGKLKWSASYFESLRAFARLLNLPLLIAWKRGRLWVLTDASHFTKKVTAYHLTFEEALKNSLMSVLFGNVWIRFTEDFRLEFRMRIKDDVDFNVEVLPEGTCTLQIEDAGLWGSKGRLRPDQGKELWWFLVTAASETTFDRVHDIATQRFIAESASMFNLSDVLLAQLLWNKGDEDAIEWLTEIRRGLPKLKTDLHELLRHAVEVGAVRYVFDQIPQVVPDFLKQAR